MKIVLAITGASGSVYGRRAYDYLSQEKGIELSAIVSKGALAVAKTEGVSLPPFGANVHEETDFMAFFASGSNAPDAMLVAPCSLKTLSAIANGYCDNLVSRSAEVCLKEGKKLVLVIRETPLSPIALENMLKLSRIGATVLPASPGFYSKPSSVNDMVDFVIGKSLDSLGIGNSLFKRWAHDATDPRQKPGAGSVPPK
ncbi:MAG TPA: UbiX family flavin prenyltransferase [Candidatus Micrarchaeota archaeon]|nr:UbiX family flavin prenyltransferase [Candidatus Micrarchaeota archaeon]